MASTTAAPSLHDIMLRSEHGRDPSADGDTNGSMHTICTAPQRMFFGDIPLFIERTTNANCSNDGVGFYARLMGTIVEIIRDPPSSSEIIFDIDPQQANDSLSTPDEFPTAHEIHFVMDDGTGSIEVFSGRRIVPTQPAANQPSPTTTLSSILSLSPPPILLGQTVDCIGMIRIDSVETKNETKTSPLHGIWLAASSISIVNCPQAVTLRNLELSLSPRCNQVDHEQNEVTGNACTPKNRILVGGYLERKLNALYHCDQQGSVVFDMEEAFNYIKHSKDDGGITQKELSSLVGAFEPNEILAVNLAVEQLREDCRIYISQGKWFPM